MIIPGKVYFLYNNGHITYQTEYRIICVIRKLINYRCIQIIFPHCIKQQNT